MTTYTEHPRFTPVHRVVLISVGDGIVRSRLTDNVHDFGVVLHHDGSLITSLDGSTAHRVPWTTCPGALARLSALVGTPLDESSSVRIDKTQQCTHLFDLARLAIAYARRPGLHRFDIHAALGTHDRQSIASLLYNGKELLAWTVEASRVITPGPFEGHITTGPARWPDGVDDPAIREAALLMRRALLVFLGSERGRYAWSAEELPAMAGACYSFQPEQAVDAVRPPGFRMIPPEEIVWGDC